MIRFLLAAEKNGNAGKFGENEDDFSVKFCYYYYFFFLDSIFVRLFQEKINEHSGKIQCDIAFEVNFYRTKGFCLLHFEDFTYLIGSLPHKKKSRKRVSIDCDSLSLRLRRFTIFIVCIRRGV